MKKCILFVLWCVLFISKNVSATPPGDSRALKIKARAVKKIMEKVAGWQLKTWREKRSGHSWFDCTGCNGDGPYALLVNLLLNFY